MSREPNRVALGFTTRNLFERNPNPVELDLTSRLRVSPDVRWICGWHGETRAAVCPALQIAAHLHLVAPIRRNWEGEPPTPGDEGNLRRYRCWPIIWIVWIEPG